MMDILRDQVLLALVKRAENNELTLTIDEVDSTGECLLLLNVDNEKRTFTFKAIKKADYIQKLNNHDKRLN